METKYNLTDRSTLFSFSTKQISSHVVETVIVIPKEIVQEVFDTVAKQYQGYSALPGFSTQEIPLSYTKEYFSKEILENTKDFIFRHFVLDYLFSQVTRENLIMANWPRLNTTVYKKDTKELEYHFILSTTEPLILKEWKYFIFRSPERKNYKDIDKQVQLFIKTEGDAWKKQEQSNIQRGDWVCFKVAYLSSTAQEPLQALPHQTYWMHITPDMLITGFQELFLDKKVGEHFITPVLPFSTSGDNDTQDPCHYKIEIVSIFKGAHFSLDAFKHNFKLKSKADVHKKLIEVFSYRNDISQRNAIIEELFHLLFTKHRFEVAKHLITRKKELILQSLQQQADYHVYKNHKNFAEQVEMLAERILKEEVLIDSIAYAENITVENIDIENYLHLFNHERLREFVYFKPLIGNFEEIDTPIHAHILKQAILREKTLNYIIYTLSR